MSPGRVAAAVVLIVWAIVLLIAALRELGWGADPGGLTDGRLLTRLLLPAAFAAIAAWLVIADVDDAARRPPLLFVRVVTIAAFGLLLAGAIVQFRSGSAVRREWFGPWAFVPAIVAAAIGWRASSWRRTDGDESSTSGGG